MRIANDRVVDQTTGHPIWGGSVDDATGTFKGFYHPSLDYYDNMTGQFAVDATPGGAAASGTYSESGAIGPGPGGNWICTRVPTPGVAVPLAIFPPAPTLTVGKAVTLFVRDASGKPIAVTWQSSNTAVATVSPAPATASLGVMTAVGTGTVTIQVQDQIFLATASTTVTVVQSENVSSWLGTWTGRIQEPAFQSEGGLSCGLPILSPGSATVTGGSGNEITFTLSENGTGTLVAEEMFLVPGAGGTAVSTADAGDTLTLSGSTLTWAHDGTGCGFFSGTK